MKPSYFPRLSLSSASYHLIRAVLPTISLCRLRHNDVFVGNWLTFRPLVETVWKPVRTASTLQGLSATALATLTRVSTGVASHAPPQPGNLSPVSFVLCVTFRVLFILWKIVVDLASFSTVSQCCCSLLLCLIVTHTPSNTLLFLLMLLSALMPSTSTNNTGVLLVNTASRATTVTVLTRSMASTVELVGLAKSANTNQCLALLAVPQISQCVQTAPIRWATVRSMSTYQRGATGAQRQTCKFDGDFVG